MSRKEEYIDPAHVDDLVRVTGERDKLLLANVALLAQRDQLAACLREAIGILHDDVNIAMAVGLDDWLVNARETLAALDKDTL